MNKVDFTAISVTLSRLGRFAKRTEQTLELFVLNHKQEMILLSKKHAGLKCHNLRQGANALEAPS